MKELLSYKKDITTFLSDNSDQGQLKRAETFDRIGRFVLSGSLGLNLCSFIYSLNQKPIYTMAVLGLVAFSIVAEAHIGVPNRIKIVELRKKLELNQENKK